MNTYSGIILKGRGRGTELGYRTANILCKDDAVSGIYVARARVEDKEYITAVFADPARGVLEAHLLDFSGDLYGKELQVVLEKKLRESETFKNDEELRRAIADDIAQVRAYFKDT